VNGQAVREPGTKVDPETAAIEVDGHPVPTGVPRLTLLLNKPRGYFTTRRDPHAPRTVLDLVLPGLRKLAGEEALPTAAIDGLHPVGRLDADTEGLLLLTNDGNLTFALTHPAREVPKVYVAEVRGGVPSPEALERLRGGIELEGRRTAPARARLLSAGEGRASVEIEIHEGRKRQVRLMLAAVGHPVARLRRVRFGPLTLGRLQPGEWRILSEDEVARLRALGAAGRESRGDA
jgi:pseudouridine synthase